MPANIPQGLLYRTRGAAANGYPVRDPSAEQAYTYSGNPNMPTFNQPPQGGAVGTPTTAPAAPAGNTGYYPAFGGGRVRAGPTMPANPVGGGIGNPRTGPAAPAPAPAAPDLGYNTPERIAQRNAILARFAGQAPSMGSQSTLTGPRMFDYNAPLGSSGIVANPNYQQPVVPQLPVNS